MKIKNYFTISFLLFFVSPFLSAQPNKYFYNVDREVTLTGTIQKISLEPRYQGTAPFLSIILKEKQTGREYLVEVSPVWFFEKNCFPGEEIKIVGSLSMRGNPNLVMARTIIYHGEEIIVRDKHGFPTWRGGRGRGRRRIKRFLP